MRLINGIEMEQMKEASLLAKKEHEEKVEVRDIFDAKGDGHLDETIPDENDLNVKIEKKGKKTIIIATVTIITLLLLAIIVLSIYISKKKDKVKGIVTKLEYIKENTGK